MICSEHYRRDVSVIFNSGVDASMTQLACFLGTSHLVVTTNNVAESIHSPSSWRFTFTLLPSTASSYYSARRTSSVILGPSLKDSKCLQKPVLYLYLW